MYKRYLIIFALIIGLFSLTADSVLAQNTSMEENAAKAKVERKVRKKILGLPYYGVFDAIGFEVKKNTVTLNGYVTRPLTKDDAEDEVKEVEGVENVINNIEVLPLSTSDDRIRVRIYNAISNSGSLYRYLLGTNPSIRIIVNNGRVKLEGFVSFDSDKTLAYVAAREIFGVFEVENNLQVEKRDKKVS
jgi:hyperosmotically inducible protein